MGGLAPTCYLDYTNRIQKKFLTWSRALEGQLLLILKNNKIWRHFGIRCIIEIRNKIFKRQADRSYPIFAFDANLVLSLRYPCPEELATDALEESKTKPQKSLYRFDCACMKCGRPFWPRGVLGGIFHKTKFHSHIRSKAVFFTLPWMEAFSKGRKLKRL